MIAHAAASHADTLAAWTWAPTATTGNVFTEYEPPTPDVALTISGRPGVASSDRPADRPGLQLIVRGAPYDHDGGHALAAALLDHFTVDQETWGTGTDHAQYVEGCTPSQSEPIPLGRDDNQRPRWSLNFLLSIPKP